MSKLYVGNVPEGAKDKEIKELFEAFGTVEEVALLRGYGFVHFVKPEDASAALNALDDSEFQGAHIQVQFARTKGHGYGRGSGQPRPRNGGGRGYERESGSSSNSRSYRDPYRDSSYRDRMDRDRRYAYDDRSRDYNRRAGGKYDRYDYESYHRGYDRYPERLPERYPERYPDRYTERYPENYYDDLYPSDYYSKYADYRGGGLEGRGRSRSPGREYYSSKERSSYYDREPEGLRSRRW